MSERRFIYAIQAGDEAVKVGSANDPEHRMALLQIGNHLPLKLILTFEGSIVDEIALHKRLKRWHLRGEWFQNVTDVWEIVRSESLKPGRTSGVMVRQGANAQCEQCGALVDEGLKACRACLEFAEVRELAAQGIDPFSESVR